MGDASFSAAQLLKFGLLAEGLTVASRAVDALRAATEGRALTPADYASTSGLILRLEDDVWVNAPVAMHNPNFVGDGPFYLDHDGAGLLVSGGGLSSRAEFWVPPRYHGTTGQDGRPINNYVFTHGDRVRLSPTIGCAMVCTFCNIPYDDQYAGLKPVEAMLQAVRVALADDVQPARHMLVSGGTPGPPHVAGLREVYEELLVGLPDVEIDIMMVPVDGLFDVPRLKSLGLHQFSINLEIFNDSLAADMMRHKHRRGRQYYLDFIAAAAEELGPGRVRSMLMVGLEPLADTLAGVRAIAERGGVPVLSPFRPDPVTPLRDLRPPDAGWLRRAYLEGREIAAAEGVELGPDCVPCSHNTLTFAGPASARPAEPEPFLVAGR